MNENMTLPGRVSGLHAVRNIRELGGAEARDGRHVRCGLLYRGSTLEGLEQEERAAIDGLGLRCVLDLRAASEAAEHPEYVPEGASYQRVAGMYEPSGAEMDFSPDAIARMQSVGGADDIMRTLYLTMVRGNPALHALVEPREQRPRGRPARRARRHGCRRPRARSLPAGRIRPRPRKARDTPRPLSRVGSTRPKTRAPLDQRLGTVILLQPVGDSHSPAAGWGQVAPSTGCNLSPNGCRF